MAEHNLSPNFFDAVAAWRSLTKEERDRIGILALNIAVARSVAEYGIGRARTSGEKAQSEAIIAMVEFVIDAGALDDACWTDKAPWDSEFKELLRLPIPASGA